MRPLMDRYISVTLTLELYTPQEYYRVNDGRMGLLSLLQSGVLHQVGKVITNESQAVASVLCRELGYNFGKKIQGPWLRIYDGDYSIAKCWCSDEKSILDCWHVI